MDNLELEKVVLCGIIYLEELAEINENDFSIEINKKICKAINDIKQEKQELNIINVANRMKNENRVELLDYLSDIAVDYKINSITSFNYAYQELKKYASKKAIFQIMQEGIKSLDNIDNIDTLAQDIITKLIKIQSKEEPENQLEEQLFEAIGDIEKRILNKDNSKYFTPIFDLNKLTNGLHEGELTVIGARPRNWKNNTSIANCYYNS